MEKCIRQSRSHLDTSAPHKDVTQLPARPQSLSQERHLNPLCLLVYLLPLLEAKILGISFIIRFQGGKERAAL